MLDLDLAHGKKLTFDTLRHPTAITVVQPGKSFAILDKSGKITIIEDQKRSFTVATDVFGRGSLKYFTVAGLTTTPSGNLATVFQVLPRRVVLFDATKMNVVLHEIRLESLPNHPLQSSLPCFMDCCEDTIIITDLGKAC